MCVKINSGREEQVDRVGPGTPASPLGLMRVRSRFRLGQEWI